LADLKKILANHLYWSKFFDKALPAITLKSATYTSIGVQSDGTITLQVSVPTYSDLDKFLQVFDIADFNKDFSDIQIQAISKSQDGNGLMTNFKIVAKYDTKSISYRELNKQSTAQ
jgi:hypothetical protein